MNQPKCFSYIVKTCTRDVLKISNVNNDPEIRGNNLLCGNDEGVPILMSLTVIRPCPLNKVDQFN